MSDHYAQLLGDKLQLVSTESRQQLIRFRLELGQHIFNHQRLDVFRTLGLIPDRRDDVAVPLKLLLLLDRTDAVAFPGGKQLLQTP